MRNPSELNWSIFSAHETRWRTSLAHYVLSAVLVGVATLLTRKTQPVLEEISPLFFVAVMASTWFGGLGPGLFATILAGWASAYFFYDIPARTGVFWWDDALRLGVFLMLALLLSFLLGMRRLAEKRLRLANEQLEARVRERTHELETLIDGVTDSAIFMLDEHGQILQWNSRATQITGFTEEDVLHKSFSTLFPTKDLGSEDSMASLVRARQEGRDVDEGWRIRKDGGLFWANVIITPLYDGQRKLRGFCHVARDITELKRLEREIIEISEKEQSRIGQDLHDVLGQELTGLSYQSQNLERTLAADGRPEAVELGRMSKLINQTIEQTRELARGLSPVAWESDGLVFALRHLSQHVARSFGIPCDFISQGTVELKSHVAAVHLYRIAQEALTNAARHGRPVQLRLSVTGENEKVSVCIEDDGSGFDQAKIRSTGLGLRLMQYRARTIGASFDLCARPAGGTMIRCVYRSNNDLADAGSSVRES